MWLRVAIAVVVVTSVIMSSMVVVLSLVIVVAMGKWEILFFSWGGGHKTIHEKVTWWEKLSGEVEYGLKVGKWLRIGFGKGEIKIRNTVGVGLARAIEEKCYGRRIGQKNNQ